MIARAAARKPHVSPMLYRIIHGSSSTSLNLVKGWDPDVPPPPLFSNSVLNRSIVFKFPHFQDAEALSAPPQAYNFSDFKSEQPIETGIFVPDNPANPATGGHAIYLRQRNVKAVMREVLGIDQTALSEADQRDLRILDLLDDLPSLDPFLVKLRFEYADIPFPGTILRITDDEERAVRKLIDARLGPIVQKAFEGRNRPTESRILALLEAIWDPSLPEARMFLGAFGIPEKDGPEAMFAIKGINFYEWLYSESKNACKAVASYLRNDAAKPLDASKYHASELQALQDRRKKVLSLFTGHAKRGAEIFGEHADCLSRFMSEGNPLPLRSLLFQSRGLFWTLAHSVTAQICSHAVLSDSLASLRPAYGYESIDTTLGRLQATLNPRSRPGQLGTESPATEHSTA